MKFLHKVLCLAVVCLLAAPALMAQGFQIGSIGGTVLDQTGAALPGVTVTATHQERQTSRSEVTDAQGRFRIPSLPLGDYKVTAVLEGFRSATSQNVRVEADRVTAISLTLRLAAATESITVTAQAPVVDPTNPATTTRLSTQEYEKAPVTRSYQGIVGLSPGVTTGTTGNPTVNGALSSANQFLFDGVDTTDPTTGTFGSNLNFEAIQEVDVLTTGVSAEYGRATGAVINVITKSGTNNVAGSVKVLAINDNWNKQNTTHNSITGASFARPILSHVNYRETVTLGGPIWKDHIWAFGGLEKYKPFSTSSITTFTQQEYRSHRNEKFSDYRLDAQLTPSQHLWGKYSNDPISGIAANYVEATDLYVITEQGQGGNSKVVQYNAVFGQNFTADAMYGASASKITVNPWAIGPFDNGAAIYDTVLRKYFNGVYFGNNNRVSRPRHQIVAAGTYFARVGENTHEIKMGGDNQNLESLSYYSYGNNRLYRVTNYDAATGTFTPGQRWDFDDPGPQTSKGKINSVYLRDRFGFGRRINAEVGVRYEDQNGHNDVGQLVMTAKSWAPRLSVTYDLLGDGNTIVSGTAGRYYDFVIQGYTDDYAQNATRANYDRYDWNAATGQYVFNRHVVTAGGSSLPPSLGLKPGHMDEVTLGIQRQLTRTSGATLRYVYRKWGDMIEDIYDFTPEGDISQRYINYSGAKRNYHAIQASFDKRFSNRWSLYGNYTYSRTKGNYFVNFGSSLLDFGNETCQSTVDKTIGNNGFLPCSEVIASQAGRATFDVPHIVNLIGAYSWKLGPVSLTYGAVGNWRSGLPYSKIQSMNVLFEGVNSGYTESYYYEGRGSDRLPSYWSFDNSVEATFGVYRGAQLGLKAEIFNLMNDERITNTSTTTWCNADTPTCATYRSRFGAQTSRGHFQTPRSYRFTALVRF